MDHDQLDAALAQIFGGSETRRQPPFAEREV